jgi:hypothetical protein
VRFQTRVPGGAHQAAGPILPQRQTERSVNQREETERGNFEGDPRVIQEGRNRERAIAPSSQAERSVSQVEDTERDIDCGQGEHRDSDDEEEWTDGEQDKQDELNMSEWMGQANEEKGHQAQHEPCESMSESIELQLHKKKVTVSLCEAIRKQCEHTSYNLESYEMVERAGWSWMEGSTLEKECGQCQQKRKLSSRNPMFYCRACHAHGICNGCWSSLLLNDGSAGRGQRKKHCRNGDKVNGGNLLGTEGWGDEDSIGCISISSGKTWQETEDDKTNGKKKLKMMKGQSISWIRSSCL